MSAAIKLPDEWKPLRLHRKQSQLFYSTDRLVAVRAARRSGKTTIAKRRAVLKLPTRTWHGAPPRILYIAPTRPQAKAIAWDSFKNLVHPSWRDGKPSETELTIRTIWGSQLTVGGFDVPQRFEGVPWDFVIVDESADIKPRAVDTSIIPALADVKGICWRIGVPKRTGIGAREFNSICDDRSKGYRYFSWSAAEVIDREELIRLKHILDSKDYAEQILGQVVSSSGLAYYEFNANDGGNVINSSATRYNPNRRIVVGSDFNVNPMAWCLAHVYDGKVFVFDELYIRNTNTASTLSELHRRYPNHKAGWSFYGDATSRARKTAGTNATQSDYLIINNSPLFQKGEGVSVNYPRKNPPVKNRLASVNAMLCNAAKTRRAFINPSCTHLIDDLLSRGVDEVGQPINATADSGHATDAFGYLIHGIFPLHLTNPDWTEDYTQKESIIDAIQLFDDGDYFVD
jgi:hypothetical protein